MNKTSIEWADYVWNPVTGCTKVSEGCRNCYAEAIARRFWGERKFTDVMCHPERLDQPSKVKKPGRVFVNSMSDLFHSDVPFDFVLRCWIVMASNPQHTFIILTKRTARMNMFVKNWLPGAWGLATMSMKLLEEPIPNIWLGVPVEDQRTADLRIPALLQTPAAVRFVSVEPMLGAVDLRRHDYAVSGTKHSVRRTFLDWVICGGESGPKARPVHPAWVRALRDQCVEAGVPFFYKQGPCDRGFWKKMPDLDGQVWDQYPEVAP